jgi:hypothetical protein
MENNSDIAAIIPAAGWVAVFDCPNYETREPVACFALHHNGEIVPMMMHPVIPKCIGVHALAEIISETENGAYFDRLEYEAAK